MGGAYTSLGSIALIVTLYYSHHAGFTMIVCVCVCVCFAFFVVIGASLSEPHIDVKAAIFSILWYDGPLFLNVCGAARYL